MLKRGETLLENIDSCFLTIVDKLLESIIKEEITNNLRKINIIESNQHVYER